MQFKFNRIEIGPPRKASPSGPKSLHRLPDSRRRYPPKNHFTFKPVPTGFEKNFVFPISRLLNAKFPGKHTGFQLQRSLNNSPGRANGQSLDILDRAIKCDAKANNNRNDRDRDDE